MKVARNRHALRFQASPRAEPWGEIWRAALHRYLVPFYYANWLGEWAVYILGKWSLLELLEYAGSFSILIAVIFYFADSDNRTKQKHYQAWQVINTAQGKGGSGGRVEALQELNDDHVPLVGVDLSDAFLQDINLSSADLRRGNFSTADMRRAVLRQANFDNAILYLSNLRGADLTSAVLDEANLSNADLTGAQLHKAKLTGRDFTRADLRDADFRDVRDWQAIKSVRLANVHGIRNAPAKFPEWASQLGAVDVADDAAWNHMLSDRPTP